MKAIPGSTKHTLLGLLALLLIIVFPLSSAFSQGMTPADKLKLAKNLCDTAKKRLGDAEKDCDWCKEPEKGNKDEEEGCDCALLGEAFHLLMEALSLTSQVVGEAKELGDPDLLQKAYGMAERVGKVLQLVGKACRHCTQSRWATQVMGCCCNCQLADDSVRSLAEASTLAAAAADDAEASGDADLAQQAYDAAQAIGEAIVSLTNLLTYCAHASTDPVVVNCCGRHVTILQGMLITNEKTMEKAITAGAVPPPKFPEGPPGDDEPPIRDHEQPPASPV